MNMDYANATLPQIMPTNAYTIGSRHEEKHAHETLVANLPAHIINTYLDGNKGWRNTKAAHGALAYIQELEAANVRLRVEIGWLTEDNEEMKGKLDETERRLQEGKRQNGVLQELLEERMKVCYKQRW